MLSIVMPVRNEGLNLRIMLKILNAVVEGPHEVVVVVDERDDASVTVVEATAPHYATLATAQNRRGAGSPSAVGAGRVATVRARSADARRIGCRTIGRPAVPSLLATSRASIERNRIEPITMAGWCCRRGS